MCVWGGMSLAVGVSRAGHILAGVGIGAAAVGLFQRECPVQGVSLVGGRVFFAGWACLSWGWAFLGASQLHLLQVILQLVEYILQLLTATREGHVDSIALQPQVLCRVPKDGVNECPQVG